MSAHRAWLLPAYVAVQVGIALTLAYVDLWPGTATEVAVANAKLQALAGGITAIVIFWRASDYPETRRTWKWAGWAATFWFLGQSWLTYQLRSTGDMPRPSFADAMFVSAVVCAVIAALTFPSIPSRKRNRLRITVDGSVLAGCVLYLHLFRVGDLIERGDKPWLLAYPVADCLVITLLLTASMRAPRRLIPSLGTAALGLVVLSISNLETFRLSLEDHSTLDTPINAGFALGLALVGLGAMLQRDPREEETDSPRNEVAKRGQRLLPYALTPVVVGVLLVSNQPPEGLQLGLLMALGCLLLLRQVLVVEENAALASDVVRRARRYEALVQGSSELVLVVDQQGTVNYTSPSVDKALGRTPDLGESLLNHVSVADRARLIEAFAATVRGGRGACTFTVDGSQGRLVLEARLTDRTREPSVGGIVVNGRDVTAQATAQAALEESEMRYRRIVETAQEGIWVTDAGGITRFINARAAEMLKIPLEGLVGRPTVDILWPHMDEGRRAEIRQRMAQRRLGDIASYEFSFDRHDGSTIHTQITASPLFDAEGKYDGSLTMITDVTARTVAEEQLRKDARTDPLTGLANRAYLSDRAARALESVDLDRPPALVYCDLDGFKTVNDAWGHSAGDELLRQVAQRLLAMETEDMTIGRLGGDEFAVLFLGATECEVDAFVKQLMAALREPYIVAGREHHIDLSVGVAVASSGDEVESLLRNADLAMYQAKADGRGRSRRYVTSMHEAVTARIDLENDLRHALERNELKLHYQPVISLSSGFCVGAEALIRWQHPTLGEIGPDAFLPAAEVSDLILRIGEWVLQQAMRDAALWPVSNRRPVVSVNVAPQQLMDARHVARLEAILRTAKLPAEQVLLEVTERSLLAGAGPRDSLRMLRATGARLALDDFGTGYSSIAHLRDHPVDVLKLDRSYVSEVGTSTPSGRLALAILEMSRTLGISCTAEGIETEEQAEKLAAAGCAHAQGFLFAPALPHSELLRWLAGASEGLPVPRRPAEGADTTPS